MIASLIPYPVSLKYTKGYSCVTESRIILREGCGGAYTLSVTKDEIRITGDPEGIIYGKTTLAALRRQFADRIPCLEIKDAPAFPWRGFMVDSVRHFLPVEDVKRLLDAAHLFKLNRMHWHLTDDQGWRLEIKKYPLLTEVASKRGKSCFSLLYEPERNDGFYSRQEVLDIVSYGKDLGIEIIPEIEIPGHNSALLYAYPHLSCKNAPPARIQTYDGVFPYLVCGGSEGTLPFLMDVLDEVMEMFPSQWIHIGGDEAAKKHWRGCPDCQAKIRQLGLKDENELQQWLVTETGKYLKERGRTPVVWNESLRGNALPAWFMVQAWTEDEDLILDFARRGGKIIQSSISFCYLDYPYHMIDLNTIEQASLTPDHPGIDPGGDDGDDGGVDPGIDPGEDRDDDDGDDAGDVLASSLLGVEAPLWSERVSSLSRAGYQLFPRLGAIAEKAWRGSSPAQDPGLTDAGRSVPDFDDRFESFAGLLEEMGLPPAPRSHWRMDEEGRERDKAEHLRIIHTEIYDRIRAEQNELLKEEMKYYGR